MTTAKTTFNRATEENRCASGSTPIVIIGEEYERILTALAWIRAATSTELIDSKTAAPHISRIMERLEDLKPYLFPEINKVNY